MKSLLISLIGSYEPVTYSAKQVIYNPAIEDVEEITSTVIASGLAGIDWSFVLAAVAFIVCIYCVFRIIGSVISGV